MRTSLIRTGGDLVGDAICGLLRVSSNVQWDDRGIDDTDVGCPVHLQVAVDDTVQVTRGHRACTDGVLQALHRSPRVSVNKMSIEDMAGTLKSGSPFKVSIEGEIGGRIQTSGDVLSEWLRSRD